MGARSTRTIQTQDAAIRISESGSGDPGCVFLHYWGGSGRTWDDVIDRIDGRTRCVAVDQRGWGESIATKSSMSRRSARRLVAFSPTRPSGCSRASGTSRRSSDRASWPPPASICSPISPLPKANQIVPVRCDKSEQQPNRRVQ